MAALKELVNQYQTLNGQWKKKDHSGCAQTLSKVKVALMEIAFLPTDELPKLKQELMVARDILEIGANYSIAAQDVESFERYMAQLKTYYSDYSHILPESPYQFELLGLNLLCLLSKNKIADFHTELEQLPSDTLQNNPYIRNPVRLEQFIMEGNYNKVIMMKDNVPAESYSFFINKLMDTIRDEIASCMEKAYEQISSKDCTQMLQLDSKAGSTYIKERGWNVGKDGIIRFLDANEKKPLEEVPTEELAKMSITYAREMEQIV
ncbi:hypothetical protein TCAL_04966 [Tigriopus californicus]|uniref:26S proteasome non-ATPase regulatory subunit 8 n=2 Tax=Tigriopus californicus TaxID=6832 RepID=A0A553PB99_TIGCA|nr:26S proteasome non-ATPase regulatory subunit 8-like isoform X1 [Tigriopus californicus]TRY74962.1 hypothetical protein TCAL_04966 [Tigriopus californicus]